MPSGFPGLTPATCHPDKPNGGAGLCMSCYSRVYYRANIRSNPDVRRAEFLEKRRKAFGIDLWNLALMLAVGCPCCGGQFHTDNVPYFDHDHKTEKFRGLLCQDCNSGLGMFKDNPNALRNALDYLAA